MPQDRSTRNQQQNQQLLLRLLRDNAAQGAELLDAVAGSFQLPAEVAYYDALVFRSPGAARG